MRQKSYYARVSWPQWYGCCIFSLMLKNLTAYPWNKNSCAHAVRNPPVAAPLSKLLFFSGINGKVEREQTINRILFSLTSKTTTRKQQETPHPTDKVHLMIIGGMIVVIIIILILLIVIIIIYMLMVLNNRKRYK